MNLAQVCIECQPVLRAAVQTEGIFPGEALKQTKVVGDAVGNTIPIYAVVWVMRDLVRIGETEDGICALCSGPLWSAPGFYTVKHLYCWSTRGALKGFPSRDQRKNQTK